MRSAIVPAIRSRYTWWIAGLLIIASGLFLISKDVRRALDGEHDGAWMLVSFILVMAVGFWLVRRYWTLILDDRDTLEVFTIAAVQNKTPLAHFHREHPLNGNIITERGYSYSLRDGETPLRMSLVYLGKETEQHKTIIGEQALLTIAVRVAQPFTMAIMNPKVDIRESLDVEFYAPIVMQSKRYSYQRHGIVFSNYDKKAIQATFENPFLQTELIELFERCHFKFVIFDQRKAIAVKTATVENVGRDVEAYPVLMAISSLIAPNHQEQIHHIT